MRTVETQRPHGRCASLGAGPLALAVDPSGQMHSEYVYAFPPVDLLLPMWIRLQTDRADGIAIVPMSFRAPWWTIMTSGLQSDIQMFPGTSLIMPEKCAKLNAHNRLKNLEYAIVEFDFGKSLYPTKYSPTCAPLCPQGTVPRPQTTVLTESATAIAARRDLWRVLSTPSVRAVNHVIQKSLNL